MKNTWPKIPLQEKGICVNCYQKKGCRFGCFGEEVFFCEEYSFRESGDRESRYFGLGKMDFPGFDVKGLIPGLR